MQRGSPGCLLGGSFLFVHVLESRPLSVTLGRPFTKWDTKTDEFVSQTDNNRIIHKTGHEISQKRVPNRESLPHFTKSGKNVTIIVNPQNHILRGVETVLLQGG